GANRAQNPGPPSARSILLISQAAAPSAKTSQSPPKHAIHGAPFGAASKPITIGAPTTPTTAPPTFKRNDQRRSTAAALPSFGAGTGRFTAAHTRAWAPRRRKPRLAR